MAFQSMTVSPTGWTKAGGPQSHIVVSSRVRLARNLRSYPFPGWAKKTDRLAVMEAVKRGVDDLPEMKGAYSAYSQDLSALDKQVLVERHLISREHAGKSGGSAVVMSQSQEISIMINEEDHLRMQAIQPGLQLNRAFELIDRIDSELEERLDFAFSPRLGYLTACPSNVGTGMRASAMVHLPGLVLNEQINQIIQGVNKIGLAVRGLYGEGTEALGNLFQVSNQITLGETEESIIKRLNTLIEHLVSLEKNARLTLMQKKPVTLLDNVGRAYGILRYVHSISSKEALNLLSFLKLGIDLGYFPEESRAVVDELFITTQPAHLQKGTPAKLQADERDALRADIVREKVTQIPEPNVGTAARGSMGGSQSGAVGEPDAKRDGSDEPG